MSRPYALAGCSALVCMLGGAGGALVSCDDPTASGSFSSKVGARAPAVIQSSSAECSNGSPLTRGPQPDAGYCSTQFLQAYNEDCPAGTDWIPGPGLPPPPVPMATPPPHPDTECPFYRGAYQNFMIAFNPIGSNAVGTEVSSDPVIVNYPTIDDAFQFTNKHLPRNTGTVYPLSSYSTVSAGPATGRAWLGAVRQAGNRNVLVDQDDHTLFYGLHMNQAFYDFIQENGLNTVNGILTVPPGLEFPPGLVEFKSAWKDIDPQDFPNGVVPDPPEGDFAVSGGNPTYMIPSGAGVLPTGQKPSWDANYITTYAWVPYLTKVGDIITEDADHPVLRKVALVAVHSVYTFPGHPEFVWGSVQHVNLNAYDPGPVVFAGVNIQGAPDSQPYSTGVNGQPSLPPLNDPNNTMVTQIPSMNNYLLYKGGTPENQANAPVASNLLTFDETTQSFPGQGALESIYRQFPGSKADTLNPDTAVFSLNSNINTVYANALAAKNIDPTVDKRMNYRLVAAVWLDKPYFFGTNYPGVPIPAGAPAQGAGVSLQNDDGTNPLVVGVCGSGAKCVPQNPPNLYPNVSQGVSCGTPLDSTNTSGDSPNANGTNNTVPGCSTRADDLAWQDDPSALYASVFNSGGGPEDSNDAGVALGIPPIHAAGTDYEFSLLGGEDRLSSTSMESFTQNGSFHNCFACHNTHPVNTNGTSFDATDPTQKVILSRPANINVSHLFSEFILRDATEVCNAATIPCPAELPADAGSAGH